MDRQKIAGELVALAEELVGESRTAKGTLIRVRWDTNDPNNEGWYAEVIENGRVTDDSMKVWFPVDLDKFGQGQARRVVSELKDEFPDAEIELDD